MKAFNSFFVLGRGGSTRRIWGLNGIGGVSKGFRTSSLAKWDNNVHLQDNGLDDDHDEIELELGFQSSLNTYEYNNGDQFFSRILQSRKSRKYKRKLQTMYGFREPPIDLKKFDLNGLPMDSQVVYVKTEFESSDDFNGYMNLILSKSYYDPKPFNSIMMNIIKGVNSYQSYTTIESFNLMIRYLIRRGKWGRIFQMIDLMPLYNVYPNRETLAWMLRGCHNKIDKIQRMNLLKSVLNLGINKWKMECSAEIKILIWLALPYSKKWVDLNNVLFNEGLVDVMGEKVIVNHYIRNMAIHFMWVKSMTSVSTYKAISHQFIKRGIHCPHNRIFSEVIKDPIKHRDYEKLLQVLTNTLIMSETSLDIEKHAVNAIGVILKGENQLLNSVVFMNELIVTYPTLQSPLADAIVGHLNGIEGSEAVMAKLRDKSSGVFMLRWREGDWGKFRDMNPIELAIVEEIHRVGN